MEEYKYEVMLKMATGIGSKTAFEFIEYFGSAKNVITASDEALLKVRAIDRKKIDHMITLRKNIMEELKEMKAQQMDCVTISHTDYPKRLKNIYNPPYGIYKKGSFLEADQFGIAIVGSRKATPYGKWVAYKFASELAKAGITVISGMAYGIDTAAHKGALENGGRTIAVLGCGLDICYPKHNLNLMKSIMDHGAVMSEYPLNTQPYPYNFPIRNRIISGMSLGVIVVEANIKSGSLITANLALEQGKDVFAVPGNINSKMSEGTNKLIEDGAFPALNIKTVLEVLNIKFISKTVEKECDLSYTEEIVYKFISENQPVHFSKLELGVNLRINEMNSILTILEMKGIVEQFPGKIFVAK